MNFLAHIYLSGDDEQLMIGNFIADFVKGKRKNDYPPAIRKGIELHRMIDDYTDHHPIVLRSKERISGNQKKYSGVVIDLFYDHFLAKNFSEYHALSLKEYSEKTYFILKNHWDVLPAGVHLFLPYMIERNWLLNYAAVEGIGRALSGLSTRVGYENNMHHATDDLKKHYAELENDFKEFFPSLQKFVREKIIP